MFDLSRLGAWRDLEFFDAVLPGIEQKLKGETRAVFPPIPEVFAALEATQPDDVKVVILGQDPYPQRRKAHGFAFSIPNPAPKRRPDSLDNILFELNADLGVTRQGTDLSDWAAEGVLLFNCLALTVPEGKAGGHRAMGWKALTQQVLARLCDRPRAYLFWGGDAHKAGRDAGLFGPDADARGDFILRSSHPSPMGVHKVGADFVAFRGARPFSRTNEWLQTQGQSPINWAQPKGTQ